MKTNKYKICNKENKKGIYTKQTPNLTKPHETRICSLLSFILIGLISGTGEPKKMIN